MGLIRRAMHAFDEKRRDVSCDGRLRRAVLFGLICSIALSAAGCATISPRNVLPQARSQPDRPSRDFTISVSGAMHRAKREIEATVMADAARTATRSSRDLNFLAISGGAEDVAPSALACWSAGAMQAARARRSIWSTGRQLRRAHCALRIPRARTRRSITRDLHEIRPKGHLRLQRTRADRRLCVGGRCPAGAADREIRR